MFGKHKRKKNHEKKENNFSWLITIEPLMSHQTSHPSNEQWNRRTQSEKRFGTIFFCHSFASPFKCNALLLCAVVQRRWKQNDAHTQLHNMCHCKFIFISSQSLNGGSDFPLLPTCWRGCIVAVGIDWIFRKTVGCQTYCLNRRIERGRGSSIEAYNNRHMTIHDKSTEGN